ncbi:MAG: hypothetical protein K0U98_01900 [Deltaproteobacteria bacterium]|nr:hypothetical protein [Deltaproteobacteria bacterium]
MTRPRHRCLLALGALLGTLAFPGASSADEASVRASLEAASTVSPQENPLSPFGRLVGGKWKISLLTHEFEWGIGQQSVFARSYDEAGELAAEARWFWHPEEKTIRGYSVGAKGNTLAEMTTHFEGDTLINELELINPDGERTAYTGHWVFTDEDHYDWTLFTHGPESAKTEAMKATATRLPPNGNPQPAEGEG